MYLNSFSVRIEGGNEQESGYVEMRHGTTYAIVMRNERMVPCDAEVSIDGKDIGTFRIEAHGKVRLERPASEAKKFTFFKRGTSEACKSGIHEVDHDDRGLIAVTFKPGMSRPIQIIQPVICTCNACIAKAGKSVRRRGAAPPCLHDHMDETINNTTNWTDLGCCDSEGWDAKCGVTGSTTSCDFEEITTRSRSFGKDNVREHMLRDSGDQSKGRSQMGSYISGTAERKSGITGMTGHSNQRFADVHALTEYDADNVTVINMRLVSVSDERQDPTPLKAVMKSTPIPPAVYQKW